MAGAPKGNRNAAKGRILSKALQERLDERDDLKRVADVLVLKALDGDMSAIKEIFDRIEGKPKQTIAGDPENPLTLEAYELTDTERSARIAALLDQARSRRNGESDNE